MVGYFLICLSQKMSKQNKLFQFIRDNQKFFQLGKKPQNIQATYYIATKMNHSRFAPKCWELTKLIWNEHSIDEISQFLDQDPKLIEYLQKNEVFDEKHDSVWREEFPPLHRATIDGRVDILRLFTETYKFCIDATEINGGCSITTLHWAVYYNNSESVRFLLEQGANPNLGGKVDGKEFKNALALAEGWGGNKEIKTLLQKAIKGERMR